MKQIGQTLYKLDSKGKQREWKISVGVNDDGSATILAESGILGGGIVPNSKTITEGKNIGKSNETTPHTQALAEAQATYDQKLREGYVTDLSNAKQATLGSGIAAPMLAQKYHPTGEQKGSKTLEKMKLKGKTIHVQPKLDGNRCLIKVEPTASGIKAGMYTRKGDFMPVQLQHLLLEVLFCYEKSGITHEIVLDGELFSNEMSFNELNGHLKRKDSQDAEQLAKIKYHLYDCMENLPYDERYQNLQNFLDKAGEFGVELKAIELVPSFEIEATDENIKTKLEDFLAEGHEGLMIRTLNTGYENKRSWQLCKVKIFEDAEFEVADLYLDVRSTDGGEILGGFVMKMKEASSNREGKTIETFKAGISGISHEEGMQVLADKDKYVGKMATVEYFGLSEYGVPRFPKFKALREDA